MNRILGRYSEEVYALMRFVLGLMFLFHGSQKLFGYPGDRAPVELLSVPGLGGVIEFFGGLMIALGFFAGWAAFIASGTMAVAYFMRHFDQGFLPIVNKGELAVVYCFAFLYIATKGSGKYSIDQLRTRSRD